MEGKRSKFAENVNRKVDQAVKKIRAIGSLADPKKYEYSAEDGKKITKHLQRELNEIKRKFSKESGKKDQDGGFNIDS